MTTRSARISVLSGLLLALLFSFATPARTYAWDTAGWDPCSLDYGLYWAGTGNTFSKYVAGQSNPNYSPSKPTIIYVHGWEKDTTPRGFRETFNWYKNDPTNGLNINTAESWLSAGWNVGIFYWNQFSDEGEVKDAEAKIWTPSGPRGMRWRKCDGTYQTFSRNVSAAQLFYESYTSALSGYYGTQIRIVGHSLGNQMAIRMSKMVSDNIDAGRISSTLLPRRVTLADPFWSKDGKDYLGGKWTGEVSREFVTALKGKGVIFEYYKTSGINDFGIGDSNTGMRAMTAFQEMPITFVRSTTGDPTGDAGRHIAAPNLYFLSYAYAAPKEYTCSWTGSCTATGNVALSAKTSDTRVKELMGSSYWHKQIYGLSTATPSDDGFERRTR